MRPGSAVADPDAAGGAPLRAGASRLRSGLPSLVLFAVGFALYARTLGYEFVNWDDNAYVLENPWIREISLANLVALFTGPVLDSYFPLQSISYMLDHGIWEFDPFGYHLTSLLLYALLAPLAWQVLRELSRRPVIAFVAALLFAVHHSHVSSVAWISGRKELLFAFFLLASLRVYLAARRGAAFHWPLYALSVLLFALGAAGKASIAVYPAFFLLADLVLDARLPEERRRGLGFLLATKLPFALAALPFVWMNSLVQATATSDWASDPLVYALVQGQAGWRYLWLLLGLYPGQPIYDLPPVSLQPVLLAMTLLPLLLPPLLFALALWRGHRDVALAIAWFAIGLAPPTLFPVIHFMADRYLFVPSLGACWLLATAIVTLAERLPARVQVVAIVGVAGVAVLSFARLSWSYTPVWRDGVALWSYAREHSADGRVAVGLSAALIDEGRLEEAEKVLRETQSIGPKGEINLASIYLAQNRQREGLAALDRAHALLETQHAGPEDFARVLYLRGQLLWALGRRDEASAAWQEALRLRPGYPEVVDLLFRTRGLGAGDS